MTLIKMSEDTQQVNKTCKKTRKTKENTANNNDSDKKVKESSLYDILGVSKNATQEEIKAQYLKLSLIYHPDKETGDAKKFKSVMLAYKVLSSKKKRDTYDESLSTMWDELKEKDRDIGYHTSLEHTKLGADGKTLIADVESFNMAFMNNRNDSDSLLLNEILKGEGKKDLGASNPLFGKVESITAADSDDLLSKMMKDRRSDELYVPGNGNVVFETLKESTDNAFNLNLFNQIFNNLKEKKQDLANYEERNEDEFLSGDQIFGNYDRLGNEWQKSGSMFSNDNISVNSNMGGLRSLASDDNQMFAEMDLEGLMKNVQSNNYDVTYTRDLNNNDSNENNQIDEYNRRMEEIMNDRQRLLSLDKADYIIRQSKIAEALGDPTLFDDSIMTIDPVRYAEEVERE